MNSKILAFALMALAAPAFAATSGTLTLQGTVAGILEISVTPTPAASALDLTANTTELLVATVNERSNRKAGYTVTVQSANAAAASANAAFLKSVDALNADTLGYTMSYAGAAVALVGGVAQVSDVSAKTAAGGTDKELRISYDGAASFLNADDYADTLTFTITAK
jgi:hypothetical protein